MPRYHYMQNSFISGQVSPKLVSRTEVNEYKTGLKELTNMHIYRSGGASRRNGFKLGGNDFVDTLGNYTRIPFTQLDGSTVNVIVKVGNNAEIYQENDPTFTNDFISAGVITNLENVDDASQLGWVQHNRDLIIVHATGDLEPIIISETFPSALPLSSKFTFQNWTDEITLSADSTSQVNTHRVFGMPIGKPNNTSTTISPSATPTIGASLTFVASDPIFDEGHENTFFYVDQGGTAPNFNTYAFKVVTYNSSTSVSGTVVLVANTPTGAASDYWYEANWSNYRGWPKTVQMHNGALVFGGNKTQPTTLWSSEVGSMFEFNFYFDSTQGSEGTYSRTPVVTAASPFERTLGDSQGDAISWMKSARTLLVGTTSTEFAVDMAAGTALPQTREGGASIQASSADNFIYYVSRDRKSIHEIGYSNDNGSFISRNITTLSDDLIGSSRIKKLTWYAPSNTLYFMTDDNKLYSVTLHRSAQVTGFSSVPVEGNVVDFYVEKELSGDDTLNVITDKIDLVGYVAPSGVGMQVLRLTDKEAFDHYLDYSELTIEGGTPGEYPTSYAASTVVTAIDVTTGTVYKDLTVDGSGNVIPGVEGATLLVGLQYTSRLITLNLEVGPNPLLNSQGDINRIDRVTLKLYKTKTGTYGSVGSSLYDFELEDPTVEFSGNVQVDLPQSPDDENFVIVETDEPLPMNILGMVMRGSNNGG